MPFDSEGTFTRVHNWEDDRINGISIDSDRMDEEHDDIADGLSKSVLRDGRSAMTGNLNMAQFQIRNLKDGTSTDDAVNKGQLNSVDGSALHKAGAETITGVKTFSVSPKVPTASTLSNDETAANTAFVKRETSSTAFKTTVLDWISPKYANGTSITSGSNTTSAGWLVVRASGSTTSYVNIGSARVYEYSWGANYGSPDNAMLFVGKGENVTFQNVTIKFYQCKGA